MNEQEPLGMTVHSLPRAGLDPSERTRSGRWKLLLVLLVCASPVIASYFTYFVIRPDGRNNYATLVQPTRTMPDLGMRTLDGQVLRPEAFKDQWVLVVVAPGACPRACEDQLYMQRQLREMMGRERERIDKLWLIPDTDAVRPDLLEAVQATPAMRIARVDAQALRAWLEPESGHTLEEHLYVVDPMGEWMMRTPVPTDPAKFKRDLDRLLRASAFWDQAGQRR